MLSRLGVVFFGIAVFLLGACGVEVAAHAVPAATPLETRTTTPPEPSPTPPVEPLGVLDLAGVVSVDAPGWISWSALDTRTGELVGSENMAEANYAMSMIKAWIAADYLHTHYSDGKQPSAGTLAGLATMIRDSANGPAHMYWGGAASIKRLRQVCGATDVVARPWSWSLTGLSSRDAVHLGACVADGRAAGRWTGWLLDQMRAVRGQGLFGPIAVLPGLAIKNGWEVYEGVWYVNCMAIGDGYVLAVEQSWRSTGGSYQANVNAGAAGCIAVTRALLRD